MLGGTPAQASTFFLPGSEQDRVRYLVRTSGIHQESPPCTDYTDSCVGQELDVNLRCL